jgi:hypothetical protein
MAFEADDDNISDISNNFDSYMEERALRDAGLRSYTVKPNDCTTCDGDFAYWGCVNCPKK